MVVCNSKSHFKLGNQDTVKAGENTDILFMNFLKIDSYTVWDCWKLVRQKVVVDKYKQNIPIVQMMKCILLAQLIQQVWCYHSQLIFLIDLSPVVLSYSCMKKKYG